MMLSIMKAARVVSAAFFSIFEPQLVLTRTVNASDSLLNASDSLLNASDSLLNASSVYAKRIESLC